MIRINLLPPEIVERRKYDRYYPYVFVATGILLAVLAFTWGVMQYIVSQRSAELQRSEQELATLKQRADGLKVFELKEQELKARQQTVTEALADRTDVGRLAEEVSLVLPEEVWATDLTFSEAAGLSATFYAPRPLGQTTSDGYKSAASTLVELGALDQLSDVWLSDASIDSFGQFQGVADTSAKLDALKFTVSAKVDGRGGSTAGTGQ